MRRALVGIYLPLLLSLVGPNAAGAGGGAPEDWVIEGAKTHQISVDAYQTGAEEQAALQDILPIVRAHPDNYAGVYFDWDAVPPAFVVLFVGKTARDSFPSAVRLVRATYSLTELEATRDRIAGEARKLTTTDSEFVSVGVDEPKNRVRLVVTNTGSRLADLALDLGSQVDVEIGQRGSPAACNSRLDCFPYRGGISMTGNVYTCTYGFNARNASGTVVVITAGHCDTPANSSWFHLHNQGGSQYIGLTSKNGLRNGLDLDVLMVTASGLRVQNPYNRVYNTDLSKNYALTGWVQQYQTYVGMPIRRVGINTSRNGEVTSGKSFYAFNWDGSLWFAWGYQSSATSVPGDSGGPVWALASGTPNGLHALAGFNSTSDGRFASTGDAWQVLNLSTFCMDDNC